MENALMQQPSHIYFTLYFYSQSHTIKSNILYSQRIQIFLFVFVTSPNLHDKPHCNGRVDGRETAEEEEEEGADGAQLWCEEC